MKHVFLNQLKIFNLILDPNYFHFYKELLNYQICDFTISFTVIKFYPTTSSDSCWNSTKLAILYDDQCGYVHNIIIIILTVITKSWEYNTNKVIKELLLVVQVLV